MNLNSTRVRTDQVLFIETHCILISISRLFYVHLLPIRRLAVKKKLKTSQNLVFCVDILVNTINQLE